MSGSLASETLAIHYTFSADAEMLKKHVHVLAGETGERNVWLPAALAAASW